MPNLTDIAVFNDKVDNTGNETVAGVKTFSSSPIVPTPTTDFQASTKKYVDDRSGIADSVRPTEITANQDNFAPGAGKYIYVFSDASRDITGLSMSQVDGQEVVLINTGSNGVVLKHQSASSLAANRFLNHTAADITLAANQAVDVVYDLTQWRVFKRSS